MRRIGWHFWAAMGFLVAVYVLAGFVYGKTAPDNLLFDVAAVGAFAASLLFVTVYTVLGLRGPAKWWRNDVGTFLVIATGSQMAVCGIPAFAVMFNHGLINTQWWAWAWIGAHFLSALMVLALALLWLTSAQSRN